MTSKDLDIKSFGFAFGISFALFMFIFGLASWLLNAGEYLADGIEDLFWGFDSSLLGSLIGSMWGFLYGFIFGYLVALIYNKFSS